MIRRTKILVVCGNYGNALDEYLEWQQVLKDECESGVRCIIEARRIETPFCIMDFVATKPIYHKEYRYILPETCDSEKALAIAIGED